MSFKAIETKYRGYRFRSRLEARWAVFFDAINVEWEYEPEGFELPTTGWYLPDFRLPRLNLWYEVKGSEPDETEQGKIQEFGKGLSREWDYAIAVGPIPNPENPTFDMDNIWWSPSSIVLYRNNSPDSWHQWCVCSSEKHVGIEWHASGRRIKCGCPGQVAHAKYGGDTGIILRGYAAARSARFEHGETN